MCMWNGSKADKSRRQWASDRNTRLPAAWKDCTGRFLFIFVTHFIVVLFNFSETEKENEAFGLSVGSLLTASCHLEGAQLELK